MATVFERFENAMTSYREGRYQEALRLLMSLHDPTEDSIEYKILRRNYVLAAWVALGRHHYPPALEALNSVLYEKEKRRDNGDDSLALKEDIAAIKEKLEMID